MPRFAFLIEVENVVVNWDGSQKAVGCFVTRVVRAPNVATALTLAIARLRKELIDRGEMLNAPDNPPRFNAEESRQLRWLEKSPETGIGWYDESDET